MRKFELDIMPDRPEWSNLGPYTAEMEIDYLLRTFPDATEKDVERIAWRNYCIIVWLDD